MKEVKRNAGVYHQRSAGRGGSAGRDPSDHRHAALRRYDQKTKVMLWRILTATVLLLILQVLGAGAFEVFGAAGRWVRLAVFLVDYLVIG